MYFVRNSSLKGDKLEKNRKDNKHGGLKIAFGKTERG